MDSHDVGRGRGDYLKVLAGIKQPCLIMSIDSDVLYPPSEQEELRDNIPNSEFSVITSNEGHDGFLLEQDQVASSITAFMSKHVTYI